MLVQSLFATDIVYTFGFGSNMNIDNVINKKGLRVKDHCCASLPGWKLAFNLGGQDFVEPSYANAQRGSLTDEIHGVALGLSAEDMAKLDEQEYVHHPSRGYFKEQVVVQAYDGREMEAFVYTAKKPKPKEAPCSKRYLKILVDGAKEAGLSPDYIAKLAAIPTYSPSQHTIRTRESLPVMAQLPQMTVAELAASKDKASASDSEHVLVALLGYVMRIPSAKLDFRSHIARDISGRMTRQRRGLALDRDDDLGRPPFILPRPSSLLSQPNRLAAGDGASWEEAMAEQERPNDTASGSRSRGSGGGESENVGCLSREEHAFLLCWLDHYLSKAWGVEGVVAYLSEFREQWERERAGQSSEADSDRSMGG